MTGTLHLHRPWLSLRFDTPMRVLSWSLNRPGFAEARHILWREVRNADLPPDLDVHQWLDGDLERENAQDAVVLLTSRDIGTFKDHTATVDGTLVRCIATVGLSNAERIGARVDRTDKDWGTINLVVATDTGLSDAARIEALSIAAQARTVAVLDGGMRLPTGLATGTGTDCIAIAAPAGETAYAGLHTALGEAIGQAVLAAVTAGVAECMAAFRKETQA
jgi:adenosylcobinamide amidohydrolase